MPLQNSSLLGRPKFQTGLVKTEVIDRLSRTATTSAPTSHPTFRRTRRMYMTHSRNPRIPLHSEVQEAGSPRTCLIRNREYGDRPVRTSKELHIRVCMGTWIRSIIDIRDICVHPVFQDSLSPFTLPTAPSSHGMAPLSHLIPSTLPVLLIASVRSFIESPKFGLLA